MKSLTALSVLALAMMVASCAPPSRYNWGKYDEALYTYYRGQSSEDGKFMEAVKAVIDDNEGKGKKVPPGLYAEYGFQLLSANHPDEAILYFERESQIWPESKQFMELLIRYTRSGGKLDKDEPMKGIDVKAFYQGLNLKVGA